MATTQGLQTEARLQIPKLDGLVTRARHQKVFVGQKGAPTYLMLMACQGLLGNESLQIPYLNG